MFDEFQDINGLIELRDLITSFKGNCIFKEFNEIASDLVNSKNFQNILPKHINNPFINLAREILGVPLIPFSVKYKIDFAEIEALLMLLEFNYVYYSKKRYSHEKIIEYVFNGLIIIKLSLLVEDYRICWL